MCFFITMLYIGIIIPTHENLKKNKPETQKSPVTCLLLVNLLCLSVLSDNVPSDGARLVS